MSEPNKKPIPRTVTATEAAGKLHELLRCAELGQDVIIHRHGKRVAAIMGATRFDLLAERRGRTGTEGSGRSAEPPTRLKEGPDQ